MINGMQFIITLPAVNVNFPPNAFLVINKILMVATFDIPYVSMESLPTAFPLPTDDEILPEENQQNVKSSLDELGYGSAYTSNNLGSMYVISFFTAIGLLTALVLDLFSRFTLASKLSAKIKEKLHWNFTIRLILEGALEIAFCVYINFKYGDYKSHVFGSIFNMLSAGVFGLCLVILPFWIIYFYIFKHFEDLEDEEFEKKYGAVYEGLRRDKKSVLFYPVYFVVRRVLFMVICFVLMQHVILQLGALVLSTLISAVYILHFQPFEEPIFNNLEVMNECFTLLLLYFVYCFSDIISAYEDQYMIGYLFVFFMCLCICVHLFFLFKDMAGQMKFAIIKWKHDRSVAAFQRRKGIRTGKSRAGNLCFWLTNLFRPDNKVEGNNNEDD
jgi:hypothetical protein